MHITERMTVDQVLAHVGPLDQYDRALVAKETSPEFRVDNGVMVLAVDDPDTEGARKDILVTGELWEAVQKDLGGGAGYFAKTPPELLLPQLNWWYASEDPRSVKDDVYALTREGRDGRTLGLDFLRPDRHPVSPRRVVEVAHEKLTNGVAPVFTHLYAKGLKTVVLGVTMPNTNYEVQSRQVGDLVEGGVLIEFSPMGAHPTQVQTFVNRLWCSNGMADTVHLDLWKAPGGEGAGDVYEWLPGAIDDALAGVTAQFAGIGRLAEQEVPEEAIGTLTEDLFTTFGVPQGLRTATRNRLAEQNVDSMWSLVNAMTYAATHDENMDPRHRVRLMSVAGDTQAHTERCAACNHLIG